MKLAFSSVFGARISLSKSYNAARFRFAFAFPCLALLLAQVVGLRAQSPAIDGFDPNANGTVRTVVVQADGKILIAGDFTSVSPNGTAATTRNRIARFTADGRLDLTFDPNANNTVFSLAVQADGKILAAGKFTTIGGQTRNRIARLNTDGTVDLGFDPNANADIYEIVVQPDGKILTGGLFTTIAGQTRNHIARLDTSGTPDSFDPNASGNIFAIAVQKDGAVVVGGNFATIGGQTRNRIARLDAATGLADSFNPTANFFIESIAVQADGKILAGGAFTIIDGQTRNHIARLNTDGTLDTGFDPNADGEVLSIVIQSDGPILLGGVFTHIGAFGGTTRNRLARLNAITGALDPFFDPNANNTVLSLAVQSDGKILAVGDFTVIGGTFVSPPTTLSRNRIVRLERDGRIDQTLDVNLGADFVNAIAVQPDGKILVGGSSAQGGFIERLNTDGTIDTNFNVTADGLVTAIAVQSDGRILVGGQFSKINGGTHPWLVRLNANGGVDGNFNPNVDSQVLAIAVRPDGRVVIGGNFTSVGGQTRNGLAELAGINANTVDGFNPNTNSIVYSIALLPDGKLLVAGFFTAVGGVTRNHIARLDATTGAPDAFNPNANDAVYAVAVQVDGKILAGGVFTNIGGQSRNGLARLDPVTGLADSFNPNPNSHVFALVVQSDGKVLAGGPFTMIGPTPRNRLARLDGMTGAADTFNPNMNDTVNALALQADGKVLAGGLFTTVGGVVRGAPQRNRFARFSNDTAALSDLKVTQNAITLARGGSAPQFTHATFGSDFEFDGLFGLVGSGVPHGTNSFALTGLNFPTEKSFQIRSRGYFRTGYLNGSETTEYTFKNVFLKKLRIISIARSGANIIITYDANGANTYRLESKLAMSDPAWLPVTAVADQTPNFDGAATFTVPEAITVPRRFYRVRLLPPPPALVATVNDSVTGSGTNQWEYGAGWHTATVAGAFQGDEHYANTTGLVAHFRFNGSQVKIYTVKEPAGGNIGFSLDGGTEQTVSNYAPTIVGNSLSYTSPEVAPGNHDLVIRVVGTHEPSATSNTITVDKAELYVP